MQCYFRSAEGFRRRHEHFGSFVWRQDRREFFKLSGLNAVAYELFYSGARPLTFTEDEIQVLQRAGYICDLKGWEERTDALLRVGLLEPIPPGVMSLSKSVPKDVLWTFTNQLIRGSISKPIWAHIQPFLFCNLACTHCYCNSSPDSQKFKLPVKSWVKIIDRLDSYGIAEIYVTGGETLILPETWALIEEIRHRGIGFGVSTNAVHVNDLILARLRELRVDRINVSLNR